MAGGGGAVASNGVLYEGKGKLSLYGPVSFDIGDSEVIHGMIINETIGNAAYMSVIECNEYSGGWPVNSLSIPVIKDVFVT